jgi:hypothetical protein
MSVSFHAGVVIMALDTPNSHWTALTVISIGIFGFGLSFQQPAIALSGAGLTGGCIAKSRRDESSIRTIINRAANERLKIRDLEKNIDRLIEIGNEQSIQLNDLTLVVSTLEASRSVGDARSLQIKDIVATVHTLEASRSDLESLLQAQVKRQDRGDCQISNRTSR